MSFDSRFLFNQFLHHIKRMQLNPTENVIIALLGEKILYLYRGSEKVAEFPFSYSKAPLSCVENSLGTPTGLHAIVEKYGSGQPPGTVFVARESTGLTYAQRCDFGPDQPNLVTTRILRLRGLETDLNAGEGCDSYNRYIYVHGNNHPERFPENISAGCLILRDDDLISLFDRIPEDSMLWIVQDPFSSSALR